MVGKRCPAPRSGGSARKAVDYVLAEELTAKVDHAQINDPLHPEQRAALSALMTESLARADRGVGAVWAPSTAADGRPSSIYCRGVTSLYTAPIEIQSLFDAQSRCKSPVGHFIFSLSTAESARVSDEQLIRASIAALDGAGWKGHAAVASVHCDTLRYDGEGRLIDGNKHCHVVIASVNSRTLRAYDRTQEHLRLHRSLREQEIAFGLDEDWGLYKIVDRGLPTERVERTNAVDWAARKQEQTNDRAARLARNFVSDESGLESVRDREDRLIHALRDYLERCDDRGEKPLQSDVHVIAARFTAQVEGVIDGKLTVRLMERAKPDEVRRTWSDSFGNERHVAARWMPTDTLIVLDEKRIARSPSEGSHGEQAPNPTLERMLERAIRWRSFLLGLGTAAEAEAEYRQVIAADPGRVTRDLVYGQGQATFTADDIDTLLAAHITDGWSAETDRVLREDPTVRVVGARSDSGLSGLDAELPLYTIDAQREISEKFDRLLRQLLSERDPLFSREALDEAIRRVEARKKADDPNFRGFIPAQYRAFDSFERRLAVWAGDAGVGKSVLNEVHREMAEITRREIRGVATAQKAADVLAESSGIQSVNQARALVEEARDNVALMPPNARFVFDEFSMASIEAGIAVLERAIASNASGVLQGDLAQLPNIAAGNTFGIAVRAAADARTLVRLNDVFRQRDGTDVAFMREAVPRGGKAIRTANRAAFAAYVEEFMDRGIVVHHESRREEIAAIAADIVEAMRAGERVIAPGRSYQDCLYVSRHVREALALAGSGHEFEFDRGVIELVVGDRVLFRANNRRMGVRNGDTGTVSAVNCDGRGRWSIAVTLDSGASMVFDPARYRKIEYGYASTIHSNQGTGAPVVIGSIAKADDARSVHVTFTRAEQILRVHTHLSREEIMEQLSSARSLAAKDDALLFAAVVTKTGGPDTRWARAVAQARASADDPLRKRHETVMAQRAGEFRQAIVHILDANLKPRERDRQLRAAAARYTPDTFVTWATKERAALEQEWSRRERVRPISQARTTSPQLDMLKKREINTALANLVAADRAQSQRSTIGPKSQGKSRRPHR